MTCFSGACGGQATGRLVAVVVAAVALLWLATAGIEFPNECQMTYMRNPALFPIRLRKPDRSSFKYSLLRYVQLGVESDHRKPTGSPVLFLPGHLGSAMQARSLGSHAVQVWQDELAALALAKSSSTEEDGRVDHQSKSSAGIHHHHHHLHHRPLDVYTVDFNEEWSGISGHHLLDQAEFINTAVQTILSLYSADNRPPRLEKNAPWKRPTHVVIVAHSMAGFAARAALTLDNYRKDTIKTIITLSTPHQNPPFLLESSAGALYDQVNSVWREAAIFHKTELAYKRAVEDRKLRVKQAFETAKVEAKAAAAVAEAQRAQELENSAAKVEEAEASPSEGGSAGQAASDSSSPPPEPAEPEVVPATVPEVPRPHYRHDKQLLKSVASTTVVSVAGGFQDQLIYAGLTRLEGIVDRDRGLQFLATDLGGGVSADHLAVLWCYQVARPIAASVAAITKVSSGWISAEDHLEMLNRTLRQQEQQAGTTEPLMMPAAAVLSLDDNSMFALEYASEDRTFVARLGFIVHWFFIQDGTGALAFWLASFCCVLAQFLRSTAASSSEATADSRRPCLTLAVWPDYHNPLLLSLGFGREAPGSSKPTIARTAITVGLTASLGVCFFAQYLAPAFAPAWLQSVLFIPAGWAAKIGLATPVLQCLLAAASSTLVLHFLDNTVWVLGRLCAGAKRFTPRALRKLASRVTKIVSRHATKLAWSLLTVLVLAAHSMDRLGNEGLDFVWTFRRPRFALELAVVHIFLLTVAFVALLRLLVGLVGAPKTRSTEYQRLVLWGYFCFLPIAMFQAIASVEVLTRAPVRLQNYSWRALLHVLTLVPVTAHLLVARSFPIEAENFSADSSAAAEQAALAAEDVDESEDEEDEQQEYRGGGGGRSAKPDYAARLAARRRKRGCKFGPHELGAAWSVYQEDKSAPGVVRHRFASGEVVFEGPVFTVAHCNCAGEGLDPTEWCEYCQCKACGVRTWDAFNSSKRGNGGGAWSSGSSAAADLKTRVGLYATAVLTVVFATATPHRVHIFAALVAVQVLFAHMQKSSELQRWYRGE